MKGLHNLPNKKSWPIDNIIKHLPRSTLSSPNCTLDRNLTLRYGRTFRLSSVWKSLSNPGKDPIILDSWACALELDCPSFEGDVSGFIEVPVEIRTSTNIIYFTPPIRNR